MNAPQSLTALAWVSGGTIVIHDEVNGPRAITAERASEIAANLTLQLAEPIKRPPEATAYLERWVRELRAAIGTAARWRRASLPAPTLERIAA